MLAIASGKGGSGKTTTTLGLAAALPGRTLAADLDRDVPNLLALAGVGGDASASSGESLPHPSVDGVELVPAIDRNDDLESFLDRLARRDAGVVLDCPAGAGPDAVAPLRAADGVLLVSTLCLPALRDTAKTAAMARELGTPLVGAVLTRTRQTPTAVDRLLDCPVLAAVPEVPPPVLESPAVRRAYVSLASAIRPKGLL